MQVSMLQSGLRALTCEALRSKQEKGTRTEVQNRKHLKCMDESIASRCQTCLKPHAAARCLLARGRGVRPVLGGMWAPHGAH